MEKQTLELSIITIANPKTRLKEAQNLITSRHSNLYKIIREEIETIAL